MLKLKASTLFETLIALIIIGLSSGMFISIYSIVAHSKSGKDIGISQIEIDQIYSDMSSLNSESRKFSKGSLQFQIKNEVREFDGIVEVQILAFRGDQKVYSEVRLVDFSK